MKWPQFENREFWFSECQVELWYARCSSDTYFCDQNPLAVLWVKIAWIHSPAMKRLRHSKQKLTMSELWMAENYWEVYITKTNLQTLGGSRKRNQSSERGPFSKSGNAILSYERNNSLWFKSIPHSSIERHCVDVRVYTIRIINLDGVDQSILLYVVITLFHF